MIFRGRLSTGYGVLGERGQAFTIHFEAKKGETGDITGCGLPRYVPKCKVKA